MAAVPKRVGNGGPTAYAAALKVAARELSEHLGAIRHSRKSIADHEKRVRELRLVIENLRALLPETEREERTLSERADIDPSRGGDLYRNVIQLFDAADTREWTAGKVKKALADEGMAEVEPKALYNVLNHLERKGALVRVRPGWYRIAGYGIGFPDESYDDYD